VLVDAGALVTGVRARRTFFVEAIGVPLVGVYVVLSVMTSACCVRRRRPVLLRLQVTRTTPAALMVWS
jgi:hypothetical protein